MGNQQRRYGVNSGHTVANGINPVTLLDISLPSPTQAVDQITVLINCAYGGGANDSFKAHAQPGSYIEAYVEIQTPNDANWRRLTQSSGLFRLRTTDVHDILMITMIAGATRFRIRTQLELAPTDTIDLDWMVLFNVNDNTRW